MKSEIGSEFWDIPIQNKGNRLFPSSTKWFLSGRHALEYIVLDAGIKSVSIPKWCCESMYKPFLKHGVVVEFYDKEPNYNLDAIFLIDYFGLSSFSQPFRLNNNYQGIVIRDVTHSLFSNKYNDADYYFGSLRKWAGFVTGGFAFGKWKQNILVKECDDNYVSLRLRAFSAKKDYIDGKRFDKDYLNVYKDANDLLGSVDCCGAYLEDIKKAKHLDIEFIKKARRENASYLIDELNIPIKMCDIDVPLFVPIFTNDRDRLREHLINNQIYCPIHWPGSDVNGTELSLICDQRYDLEDMEKIVLAIKEFEAICK